MLEPKSILFYKPDLVLSTFSDPEGRETLKTYIPIENIYSAGRLDYDSEGLLVITNDGGLINRITDPEHHQVKTYLALLEGICDEARLKEFEKGIELKGYKTLPAKIMVVSTPNLPARRKPITPHGPIFWARIQISEGKKHQIRHMTASLGYPCLRLVRIAIGSIGVGELLPGEWRDLTNDEITKLRK
ncbi:MAG: pseudouridine synthase [Anaerolineaceae bacterium]